MAAVAWGGLHLCGCRGEEDGLRPVSEVAEAAFQVRLAAAGGSVTRLDAALDAEILSYQSLLEEGLAYRTRMAEYALYLQQKDDVDEPLSGEDIDALNSHVGHAVDIARRLFRVVDVHRYWMTCDRRTLREAGLGRLPTELRLKGTMLSLAGSLFLYDTYRLHVAALARHDKVRYQLDHGDRGYDIRAKLLDEVNEEFLCISSRLVVRCELAFYRQHRDKAAALYGRQVAFRGLDQLIQQSPSRTYFETSAVSLPVTSAPEHLSTRLEMVRADLRDVRTASLGTLSQFFGNTVGLVETRKGKLHGDTDVMAVLAGQLEPADVLLEKTPFRLTDSLIPGHWGHVAVWIGTEQDLRRLELWDDPLVVPHHKRIRSGCGVVEALRGGVTINTLEDFLNIDDLAVVRERDVCPERRRHVIRLVLRQVGKDYDFNFDVETSDRIVCSELVYVAFTGIDWPTSRTLGRVTISPDNVAARTLGEGIFDLVLLYHDGQRVTEDSVGLMARLLEADKTE